jgi:hypothetical protein
MAPIPIEPIVSPGWLSGTIDATVMDANEMVSTILDSSMDNRIDVAWTFKGKLVNSVAAVGDHYTVKAYFDAQEAGGTDYAFNTDPAGPRLLSSGTPSGTPGTPAYTLTFSPLHIPLASGRVLPGVYKVNVVLTHQPVSGSPYLAGFYDLGIVQFF